MRNQDDTLLDSIFGCIVGGAIGDAAGAAFESMPANTSVSILDNANWQWTDDTQLTLATCEALTNPSHTDPEAIAASFLRWFRARRITGMGASTLKALSDLDVGGHWALSGRKGEQGAGNGAAMRIAPLAFCVDPLTDHGRRAIRDVSRITHHNDEAYIGALAVVLAIRTAMTSRVSLEEVASNLPDTSVRDRLLAYCGLPAAIGLKDVAAKFGVTGYVVESVPFALFASQRVRELGFMNLLNEVIAAGGDTDTNASIVGQIAGASIGLSGIPKYLLERLPKRDFILKTAQAFAERIVST